MAMIRWACCYASAEREGYYTEVFEDARASWLLLAGADDMCLEGRRGMARALESTRNFLFNQLIELKVENGEGMLRFEPDPSHVQIALRDLGLDKKSAKPLSSPSADDVEFACQGQLPEEERHHDASSVLGAGPSALDAASERGSEKDAGAHGGCLEAVKRIGDLMGRPRCVQRFPLQPEVQSLTVKVDSDLAGRTETRLSTSCCILVRGKLVLRCSSSTHKIQGFSSGESEFMASRAWRQHLLESKGDARSLWAAVPSRPGEGLIGSQRCCFEKRKIRHLHTPLLWLQRRLTNRELRIWKVKGTEKPTGTRPLSGKVLCRIFTNLNFSFEIGVSGQAF